MENHELTKLGCTVTRCGLKLPRGISVADYKAVCHAVAGIGSAAQWWLGDLYLAFKPKWGDRAAFFDQHPNWPAMGTVQNYATVCNAFQISRRRENLSFTHHALVADLEPAEADAQLDWCEERQPVRSTRDLRDKLQDSKFAAQQARLWAAAEQQARTRTAAASHYRAMEQAPAAPPEPYEFGKPVEFVSGVTELPPRQDEPEQVISAADMRARVAAHYGGADDMEALALVGRAHGALQRALALKEVSPDFRAKIQHSFDGLPLRVR
jgi:hypothetical protein